MLPRWILSPLALLLLCPVFADPALAQDGSTVPAGTILKVRLRQLVSSYGSETDQRVTVDVIAPVEVDGVIRIPMGTRILGHVEATRRVGMGLSREVAYIDLSFDHMTLPDGTELAINATVATVDNSRETVDENGRISGIRATASVASRLSGLAVSVGFLDPMLLGFTAASTLSAFRIPESEIIMPPGAELQLRLADGVALAQAYDYPVGEFATTPPEHGALEALIRELPFRTTTPTDGTPSDLTNLLFLGSEEALTTAFLAAGWSETDELTSASTYGIMRSIVENQGYQAAPMSTLVLEGREPAHTYAKTLDTFFSRHHLRVFERPEEFDGAAVWTSSSTQDIGIGIATNTKSFIHLIDENIDAERDKVVHDLVITGCVDAMQSVERPWVPVDARNATGDALLTDGRIAVVRLNACESPEWATEPVPEAPAVREKPAGINRVFRDIFLALKNDAFRGNIVYQGYWGVRSGIGLLTGGDDEEPRTLEIGAEPFLIVPGPEAADYPEAPLDPVHVRPSFQPVGQPRVRNYETRLEFSFSGGYTRFGNDRFSTQHLDAIVPIENLGDVSIPFEIPTQLLAGWNLAPKVTLHSHPHVSHEFGYTFNASTIRASIQNPILPEDGVVDGAANIRQFTYNALIHARPKGKRIRPYGAVGPAFQMIRVSEPITSQNGVFRFAFKQVGLILGAWDFGTRPPFEGGGIFQVGLQYGGGVKFYLSEHVILRLDFRETLAPQPDFWTKSHPAIREFRLDEAGGRLEPGALTTHGPLRVQTFTVGLGFGL